jgi:hypothetical protein
MLNSLAPTSHIAIEAIALDGESVSVGNHLSLSAGQSLFFQRSPAEF